MLKTYVGTWRTSEWPAVNNGQNCGVETPHYASLPPWRGGAVCIQVTLVTFATYFQFP